MSRQRSTDKNLIPLSCRTSEEQRAITVKGGKKSGEVRQSKKEMRTFVEAMTSADASKLVPTKIVEFCASQNVTCTVENAMHAAMCLKAVSKGDAMAYNAALNRLMGTPAQKVTLDGNFTNIVDPSKLKRFRKELEEDEHGGTQ